MIRIGLISDTHGFLDQKVVKYFADCDEIWHAGDFGTLNISDALGEIKPLRGVYGNIDGQEIRTRHPEYICFELERMKILMIHIAGTPTKYTAKAKNLINENNPDILICGHSHILRVLTDKSINNMLYINPGAAGNQGFHKIKTILTFELNKGKIENMRAIEIGKRGLE